MTRGANPGTVTKFPANGAGKLVTVPGLGLGLNFDYTTAASKPLCFRPESANP